MSTSIKDFIIDVSVDKEPKKEENHVIRNKPNVSYELILENNTDFVMKRKTSKTDSDLVVVVSKGLFYIKNNKNEDIKKITKDNCDSVIKNFFKDYDQRDYNGGIKFEKLSWIKVLTPRKICEIIKDDKLQNLLRYGIEVENISSIYVEDIFNMLKENPKLVRYFVSAMGEDVKINSYNCRTLVGVFKIYKEFGFNNARFLIDSMKEVEFLGATYYILDLNQIIKDYNLNVTTAIEYVTHGFKRQGIYHPDSSDLRMYRDYLQMTNFVYGKVKEKYPKYLRTQHDMITYKYNMWVKYKKDLLIFESSKEHEELVYSNKNYSILIPKTAQEMLDEAIANNSCLASYVSKVVKKETSILFLRRKEDIDETFLTVEVKDNKIIQVEGYSNRYYFGKDVKEFIEKWAKEKNLEIVCRLKVEEVC